MAQTVTIDLGDGSTVDAEIVGDLAFQDPGSADGGGYGDVGVRQRAAQLGSAVALTLDQVRDTVRGVGRWAVETVGQGGTAGAPDSFEVEFGLKLAVKSGQLLGVIAEAGSEAGLTVRLSWDLAARRAATAADAATAAANGTRAVNRGATNAPTTDDTATDGTAADASAPDGTATDSSATTSRAEPGA